MVPLVTKDVSWHRISHMAMDISPMPMTGTIMTTEMEYRNRILGISTVTMIHKAPMPMTSTSAA